MDQVPAGCHADLALVQERAPRAGADGELEVGVVEDDQRRVAAQLQVGALEMACGRLSDATAGGSGAGEGDHPYPWRLDERRADRRVARQDVQHPGRQPGLLEDPRDRRPPPLTAVRTSGLSTTALPSASAGATDRMARISGKLNGAITPTTPTGRRRARLSRGCGWGGSRPATPRPAPPPRSTPARPCGSRRVPWAPGARLAHEPPLDRRRGSHSSPARRSTAARPS